MDQLILIAVGAVLFAGVMLCVQALGNLIGRPLLVWYLRRKEARDGMGS